MNKLRFSTYFASVKKSKANIMAGKMADGAREEVESTSKAGTNSTPLSSQYRSRDTNSLGKEILKHCINTLAYK